MPFRFIPAAFIVFFPQLNLAKDTWKLWPCCPQKDVINDRWLKHPPPTSPQLLISLPHPWHRKPPFLASLQKLPTWATKVVTFIGQLS